MSCGDDVGDASQGTADATGSVGTTGTEPSTGAPGSSTVAVTTQDDTVGSSSGDEGPKFDLSTLPDVAAPEPQDADCSNIANFPETSNGCEFWAVQVPSERPECGADPDCDPYAIPDPFGIGVGNPSDGVAHVVVEDMRGPGLTLREVTSVTLAPGESRMILVNDVGGALPDEDHMLADLGLTDNGAFRVTSDVPIDAMQIYPVGGADSYIAEASLLLPTNALSTAYVGLGYHHYAAQDGWIVVVALEDATTITTTAGDVMLDAFDTWTFNQHLDATGFFVAADRPIAAFSGTKCAVAPDFLTPACDHLEEQLVPLASWGTSYVGAPHPQRLPELYPAPDRVLWRVVGAADDMEITLEPPLAGDAGVISLDAFGEHEDFYTELPFTATSDQPFMLVQYMTGGGAVIGDCFTDECVSIPAGDPYMIQVTPVDQWLEELPFLTDTGYPRDFVVLMREVGTTISLDCLGELADDRFVAIPGTSYEYGHVDLDLDGVGGEGDCRDGQQWLHASAPIGVMIGGIDAWTSYGYPGGMRLGQLWTPPDDPPG